MRARPSRALAAALLLALATAACSPDAVTPTGSISTRPTGAASVPPDPEAALAAVVAGPWRPAPGTPVDSLVDPVLAGCRAAAVPGVAPKATIGDLPVAVVDVRGGGSVSAVFADGARAVVCHAPLDGATPPVVRSLRWQDKAAPSIAPAGITITLLEVVDEAKSPRSLLVGEVGSQAYAVRNTFADDSHIQASKGGGWYVMWWPGGAEPTVVSAVDSHSVAIGGAHP